MREEREGGQGQEARRGEMWMFVIVNRVLKQTTENFTEPIDIDLIHILKDFKADDTMKLLNKLQ